MNPQGRLMVSVIDSDSFQGGLTTQRTAGFESSRDQKAPTAGRGPLKTGYTNSEMQSTAAGEFTARNVSIDLGCSTNRTVQAPPKTAAPESVKSAALGSQYNDSTKLKTSSDPPTLMWNIKDVHVGYDKSLAQQFKLQGRDEKDILDDLPRLNVDQDIPYGKERRKSHQPHAKRTPMNGVRSPFNDRIFSTFESV